MAIRIDKDDERGQTYGYWFIEQYQQNLPGPVSAARPGKLIATVIGYKNKAARDGGKNGWIMPFVIEGAAWQKNMSIAEIEAAIMALPFFAGSTSTA